MTDKVLQFDAERARAKLANGPLSESAKIIIFPGVRIEQMASLAMSPRTQAMAAALAKLMES